MDIVRQQVDVPYYEDKDRLNFSLLKIFERSPAEFKREQDNPTKLESSALTKGTMIHKWILENDDFWADYYRAFADIKWKSANQKKFADRLIEEKFDGDISILTTVYKECYVCKTKDSNAVFELANELLSEVEEYVGEAIFNEGKLPVTSADMEQLKKYSVAISMHKQADLLLNKQKNSFSEFHVNWVFDNGIICKSLMDKVVFIPDEKKIILADLKTTSNLSGFKHSFDEYRYGLQAAFYTMALQWYIDNILEQNHHEWTISQYIIAIEKGSADVKVFDLTGDFLSGEMYSIKLMLDEIMWHIETGIWNMSKADADNNGFSKL